MKLRVNEAEPATGVPLRGRLGVPNPTPDMGWFIDTCAGGAQADRAANAATTRGRRMAGPIRQRPGSWGEVSVGPTAHRSQFGKNHEFSDHYPSWLKWSGAQDLSTDLTDCYRSAARSATCTSQTGNRFATFDRET